MPQADVQYCYQHGCPLQEVAGQWVCPVEYLEQRLAGRHVVDFVRGGDDCPAALIFDDYQALPLCCPGCGGFHPAAARFTQEVMRSIAGGWVLAIVDYQPPQPPHPGGLVLGFAPPESPAVLTSEADPPTRHLLLHPACVDHLTSPGAVLPHQMEEPHGRLSDWEWPLLGCAGL